MGLEKPVPVAVPNPLEPNPVAAGAEEAGTTADCPKTVLAEVAAVLATVEVWVVAVGAAVLITGVTPIELLSVVAGAG